MEQVVGQQEATLAKWIKTGISRSPSSKTSVECNSCEDVGYIVVEDKASGYRFAFECECLLEKRVMAQLPPQYRDASLADFPEEIIATIVEWRRHPKQGLVLCGDVGRGKTYLASAICRSLILIRCRALFRRSFQFFSEMRHALNAGEEESVFAKYVAAEYLFLDDFTASASEFERRFLLELLARRLDRQLPTCLTTNCTMMEIAQQLDERVASRLRGFTWIQLQGPDLRQFPPLHHAMPLEITEEMRERHRRRLAQYVAGKKRVRNSPILDVAPIAVPAITSLPLQATDFASPGGQR